MSRILHIDLDAFFASVESLLDPNLSGKPLVVAMGDPRGRGVVATASYEARRFGVHSAMPLREALRLCPQAVIVPARHDIYSEHSRRVMDLLRQYSETVEQVSIDEAYIELEPERDAEEIAREIQQRIKTQLGLDCTLGVASNKLVAKIACNAIKPRGLLVIPPGDERQFLASLPVGRVPGAGTVTRDRLARWNVRTIGDLALVPLEKLEQEFGKHGRYLHEASLGRDDSKVASESRTRSLSQETTFDRDTRDLTLVQTNLVEMSVRLAELLEREGYRARTVVLKLRYGDFTTNTRQTTLAVPTADQKEIEGCVLRLLRDHWDRRRALRLIGVGVHNLVETAGVWQLGLPLTAD